MTTHSDSRPWRDRNLAKIAEARRILANARANRHPDDDKPSTESPPADSDDE